MEITLPNRVSKGINVEDPMLFQSGGRWYYFISMISNPDVRIGAQNLDNKHLELFEYTNEINSLCLYGNIIYEDIDGSISRFINRQDNHVEIGIRQMEKVSDGGSSEHPAIEEFVLTGKPDFMHTFIVQNIRILKRLKQNITYQISLISSAWYLLCSQIVFSNYGPNTSNVPRNGYSMMKKFLLDAFYNNADTFKVDAQSFDAAAASTKKIEIPLITNGNDNCFTVRKYIFDKMYWNKGQIDETVKFIVFNPVDNMYKCIDYNVDASWLPCERPFVIMSMFETDYEQQLYSSNVELASMAGKNATATYKDHFKHKIWDFDHSTNDWSLSNSLEEKDIAALYNARPETFLGTSTYLTKDKYPLNLNPKWFLNTGGYVNELVDWNRSYSVYQSLIDNLVNRDAIELETDGDITHQPGMCMGVVLDRTIEKVPEMTPSQREELYLKHRQIEGLFAVLKVTHRYHPSTLYSDASYTEKALLGRNFINATTVPVASGNATQAMGRFVWQHRTGR